MAIKKQKKDKQDEQYWMKKTFSLLSEEKQKRLAQALREKIDWYGGSIKDNTHYRCMMEVIKAYDPKFETKFIPAQ